MRGDAGAADPPLARTSLGICHVLSADRNVGIIKVQPLHAAAGEDEWLFSEDEASWRECMTASMDVARPGVRFCAAGDEDKAPTYGAQDGSTMDARISAAGASTAYSGTFRWVREHWCPDFPQFPPGLARPPAWRHCTGWAAYLALRLSSREPHPARRCLVHPAVVDALSLPLSVLHALDLLAPSAASPNAAALSLAAPRGDEQRPRLRVVVLEQALLTSQPAYWVEVGHMCPSVDVELVVRGRRAEANPALSADTGPLPTQLVGPELDAQGPDTAASGPKKRKGKGKKKEKKKKQKPSNKLEVGRIAPNMSATVFRGTWHDYHDVEAPAPAGTVLVGMNTGFGSGNPKLMAEWIGDVLDLVSFGAPAAFTCANDHSDVRGELAVLRQIAGARVAVPPSRNPFAAASTFVAGDGDSAYSCANAFVYAVNGFEGSGPRIPASEPRQLVRAIMALCAQWGTLPTGAREAKQ